MTLHDPRSCWLQWHTSLKIWLSTTVTLTDHLASILLNYYFFFNCTGPNRSLLLINLLYASRRKGPAASAGVCEFVCVNAVMDRVCAIGWVRPVPRSRMLPKFLQNFKVPRKIAAISAQTKVRTYSIRHKQLRCIHPSLFVKGVVRY
jgi:hypothetical protein